MLECIDYPQCRDLHIFLAGGNLGELKHWYAHEAPKAARALGCNRITLSGRRGWVRALRDAGGVELCTTVVRSL